MSSPIEEYDRQLARDITSLEEYIARDESRAKAEFQELGCPEPTAARIAAEKRSDSKHVSMDYPYCLGSDELLTALKDLQEISASTPFRLYLALPGILQHDWDADWRSVEVVTAGGSSRFDTASLGDLDQQAFLEQMVSLFSIYRYARNWGIARCYPLPALFDLMRGILVERKG